MSGGTIPRHFFTAEDITRLTREQKSDTLLLGADDVITAEAEDQAYRLGLHLIRESSSTQVKEQAPAAQEGKSLPPLLVIKGSGVELEPFGGDPAAVAANVRLKDVITSRDGSPMAAGYMALEKGGFPWTLTYDEIDIILEGELVITRGTERVSGKTGDVIFIPKGSSIEFGTPSSVSFVYVTFPADWNKT